MTLLRRRGGPPHGFTIADPLRNHAASTKLAELLAREVLARLLFRRDLTELNRLEHALY